MRRTLKEDVESLAGHIRRLVRDRTRLEAEEKAQYEMTLFGAVRITKGTYRPPPL
jgi:hypothetical protein